MQQTALVTDSADEGSAQRSAVGGVFDRAAESYDEGGIDFFGPAGRDLVQHAAPAPGERVIDLGCGKGASALPAAEAVGPAGRVLALDLAPGMVAGLRDRAARTGVRNLVCAVADAGRPPVAPGRWDLVQAGLTLFFLPDVAAALARLHRALRPGGRIAFSWFGDDDPRWNPVYEALASGFPEEERSARRPGGDVFASVAGVEGALRGAGFHDPVTAEVVMEVPVPDGSTWWDTQWTHGRRFAMERLEQLGTIGAARERTVPAVDALREPDGTLAWRPTIRHTVARA